MLYSNYTSLLNPGSFFFFLAHLWILALSKSSVNFIDVKLAYLATVSSIRKNMLFNNFLTVLHVNFLLSYIFGLFLFHVTQFKCQFMGNFFFFLSKYCLKKYFSLIWLPVS
jgi:hypothetical protein